MMFVRRKVRVQLVLLLFFIVTPKFESSGRHDNWWASRLTNGIDSGSTWNYRNKQCSGEDGKCSSSSQCCRGFVCLQAGYSDGHCIKKTSLQRCTRSRDCPNGCVCEVMGLKVDGVTGFCVARLDLGSSADGKAVVREGNRLRTGLRTGVGGLSGPEDQDDPQKTTMETVYGLVESDGLAKVDELQGMIERLEAASEPRRTGGGRRDKSYLPPRSVSYPSVRNARPSTAIRDEMVADVVAATTADDFGVSGDKLSPRERYELFCKWLRTAGRAGDGPIEVSNRAAAYMSDIGTYGGSATPVVRLGRSCTRSEECRNAGSFDRWQVCCARVNIMRHGVRLVCEKISPITRCVD